MAKSFSDRLKELIERLEEFSGELSGVVDGIDEDCVDLADLGLDDLDIDELPDIIRELKWLSEDIEARVAELPPV